MKFQFLLLGLLFVAFASCSQPLTVEATKICGRIGQSSGCSGCSSNTVDCEWCVSTNNDADGLCVPHGFCASFSDDDDVPLVSGTQLCPTDPTKEPHYTGSQLTSGERRTKEIEGIFSPHFDSHYCDFPTEPWAIDRSANPFFNNDPAGNCERVNKFPATGQRAAVASCLRDVLGPNKRSAEEVEGSVLTEVLTLKRLECLRLYNSYACTISCPKYGSANDFTLVCHDYCERLHQHCDDDILSCMAGHGLDISQYFKCAPEGEKKCFKPDLIPTSGKFEFDMCFFGDPDRCKDRDCKVALATGEKWPLYFQDEEEWGSSNGQNFNPNQLGPGCNLHGDWYSGELCCDGHAGLLYKVIETPLGVGMECDEATENQAIQDWGAMLNFVSGVECTPGVNTQPGGFCAVAVELDSREGTRALPEGLQDSTKVANCPAVIENDD